MNTELKLPQEGGGELSSIASWINIPVDEEARRSKENILRWGAYLPISCIATMIKMGWDKST